MYSYNAMFDLSSLVLCRYKSGQMHIAQHLCVLETSGVKTLGMCSRFEPSPQLANQDITWPVCQKCSYKIDCCLYIDSSLIGCLYEMFIDRMSVHVHVNLPDKSTE